MTAFRATYSDFKLVKTRKVVQIVLEVPLEHSNAVLDVLGGMPDPSKESWVGVARLRSDQPQPVDDNPTSGAKQKMDWREVQPAAQAALRCEQPMFWAFLREVHGYNTVHDTEGAASAVRHLCVAKSRSEFSTDHRKRVLWKQLDDQFQAWKAVEHA